MNIEIVSARLWYVKYHKMAIKSATRVGIDNSHCMVLMKEIALRPKLFFKGRFIYIHTI